MEIKQKRDQEDLDESKKYVFDDLSMPIKSSYHLKFSPQQDLRNYPEEYFDRELVDFSFLLNLIDIVDKDYQNNQKQNI